MSEQLEKSDLYINLEAKANRFTLKCLTYTVIMMALIVLLNRLGIFVVNKKLMEIGFGCGMLISLTTYIVCWCQKETKPWIKYFILTSVVIITTILGIMLTYHTVLLCVLPLLYSAQYNKKVVWITYFMIVVSMLVSVMGGYYFGLCDANMVFLTVQSRSYYVDTLTNTVNFGPVNDNPWLTLPLYYVLPRIMILLTMVPVILTIADGVVRKAKREVYLRMLGETDEMTRLYNRNKYRNMLKKYYPQKGNLGVIFFDVDGLKALNDSRGHDFGDQLITTVGNIIRGMCDEKTKAYRIGGDEFVMIMEDISQEEIPIVLDRWETEVQKAEESCEFPVSASIGYAYGMGSRIEELIREADSAMYERKNAMYKNSNIEKM